MRVACARVPSLPVAALLRSEPELAGRPFAVASGDGARAEVVAASPAAERLGIRRLVTVAHARSVCGELAVRVASPTRERAAREALLDAALGCAPRAELAPLAAGAWAPEACVFVDAAGVDALFQNERGFATALGARVQRVGLRAEVAVAGSRQLARMAARRLGAGEVSVLAPGEERAFLASLPLELLDPDDATLEALARFGVRSVRGLLQLPRRALATRLGPQVLALAARARGEDHEPPLAVAPVGRPAEAVDLDAAIDRLEPLLFVLGGLLSRLLDRLNARRVACNALMLRLALDGGGRDARRVGLAAPTLDRRVLVRLLGQALESHPPRAAITGAVLEAEVRALNPGQLDLFRPAGPAPDALGSTLVALQALCGEDRIGSPRPADDHRPDRFELQPFHVRSRDDAAAETLRAPAGLATRALRPPVSAEVHARGGRPQRLRSAAANGDVVHSAGPWRTTGGWWSPELRYAYDYFDVLTSDGTLSRLRFDHVARRWEIDAIYD